VRTTNRVRVAGLAMLLGLSVLLGLALGGCSGSGPGGVSQLIPNAIAPGPPEMTTDQFCATWNGLAQTALKGRSPAGALGGEPLRQLADEWAKLADVGPHEIRADLQESARNARLFADGKLDPATVVQDKTGGRKRVTDWYVQHCPQPSTRLSPPTRPSPSN